MAIKESHLTKGQIRKLNALRKSIGDDLGEQAFSKWLKRQKSAAKGMKSDPVAEKIATSLASIAKDKSIRLGRYGYTIKRSKGKGINGFLIYKNVK
jgi:hypothetical protein|tara:strand:+ start:237 stop:524 length:288 start_codon:yes stop_codon:yes gene_type:complete